MLNDTYNTSTEKISLSEINSDNESDEHSLGSCSAEVAAINSNEKRKKRETPDLIKSVKNKAIKNTGVPIRPQPFRPQPQITIIPATIG